MKQIVFLTSLIYLMQSCTNKEAQSNYSLEDVPIVIDIDSVKTDTLKTNFVHYIPLETTKDCLIGWANKVLIKNDRIYVADFNQAMALFIFDMKGNFLFKIDKRGQGPGEYVNFKDFDIQTNGDIYIFDHYRKKFLVCNPEGKYLHEITTDFIFVDFCLFGSKMYWTTLRDSGKSYANLAVYKMEDKQTEFILTDEEYLYDIAIGYSSHKFYYSPDSIIYYSPQVSEVIFSIDGDGIHPAIGIKNLKKPSKYLIEEWKKDFDDFFKYNRSDGYFIEAINIYETDKYITFKIKDFPYNFTVLYNKQSRHTCFIFDQNIGTSEVKGSIGKYFFGVVLFNPELSPSHKSIIESREELKNWREDDNPVIVIFEPYN